MSAQHSGRTVVVGIDGSESALRAARWGAAEAARRRVPLRLVTAFAWTSDHALHRHGMREDYREILLDRSRKMLVAASAAAEEAVPGVLVEQQLVVGAPIAVLGAEARHAQLVVVGDRGLSRVEGLLLGSVAVALASHAACPVAVVRGAEIDAAATAPVVVGVDGSPTSEAAIAFAFDAAASRRAPLVAVHTWWDAVADPVLAPVLDWDAIETDERLLLAERLAGWSEKYPDVTVRPVVTRDSPAHGLLAQAKDAQLVVVGSRGRGEFAGLLLGSVSNALVHKSPCPVVVVRPAEPRERD